MTRKNRLLSTAFRAAALIKPSNSRVEHNYAFNCAREDLIFGCINGQRLEPIAAFRYGLHRYANVGCEIIAAYNALCMLGLHPSISELSRQFEICGGQMLLGAWGTDPFSVEKVMERYRVKLYRYEDLAALSVAANPAKAESETAVILSFWNRKGNIFNGIHTVAVEYKNGKYTAYNRYDTLPNALVYDSIGSVIGGGKLIVGYIATVGERNASKRPLSRANSPKSLLS